MASYPLVLFGLKRLGRFRDIAQGKTVVIITHRFTTAMQADVIHVMVGGKVIESGTHDSLVADAGHYAASWRKQMRESAGPQSN